MADGNGVGKLDSNVVDLFPNGSKQARGNLDVDGRIYKVIVAVDKGRTIWARIRISERMLAQSCREKVLLEVASRGLKDRQWIPLVVDVRDGEVAYSTTLVCDLTNEALDRFLLSGKEFLHQYREELESLICDESSSAVGDTASQFDIADFI